MKLEKGKFYKTNHGDKAECLNVNYTHTWTMSPGALILVYRKGASDSVLGVRQDGSSLGGVSVVAEWDDLEEIRNLPMDAKILVRDSDGSPWLRRYFSHVTDDGRICTWAYGATAWSAQDPSYVTPWNQAKLPEEST